MLRKKRQRKYITKRCVQVRRELHAFAGSVSQESVHKLRVEIKKIRAFAKFAKLDEQKGVAERLETIKRIFHRAGSIREANINLQMMKQFNIHHPAFKTEETNIIEQESGRFRLYAVRYDKHFRNAVIYLLKTLHPVRNGAIRHWFSRQLKAIAKVVVPPSTDQLHLARKKIKRIVYVHGMLQKRLVNKLKLNITYLDQLQDAIGKWHDAAVAVELLISRKVGDKATINKLKKEQDKTGVAVHKISDGFWEKVFEVGH